MEKSGGMVHHDHDEVRVELKPLKHHAALRSKALLDPHNQEYNDLSFI